MTGWLGSEHSTWVIAIINCRHTAGTRGELLHLMLTAMGSGCSESPESRIESEEVTGEGGGGAGTQ